MKYIIKVRLPIDAGNKALQDPKFGENLQSILQEIKAEAAYFTPIDGQRGIFIVTDFDEASRLAAISEKFWFFGKADIEFIPVMVIDDLKKAIPEIEDAAKRYGS